MKKIQAARRARRALFGFDASRLVWVLISVIGMLPLAVLAALALIVLIIIILFGGSQMTSYSPDPTDTSIPLAGGRVVNQISGGDGRGTFAEARVPDQDLVEPIKTAAKECDLLTPVIIAAQIEYASTFDAKREGPGGRKGLSQLTPDVFSRFGKDDDDSGEASALDPEDSIHAHARYFCHLADETKRLLDEQKVIGDHLTLTLLAWDIGLEAVELQAGMPILSVHSYPFQVRMLFARYTTDASASASPSASASGGPAGPEGDSAAGEGTPPLGEAQFDAMFPSRNYFYTYAGLVDAMAKFPAFAGTGDEETRKREIAAFLANVDHESGGLAHLEEINRDAWGTYCDPGQPYGCPAGQPAYHGRGPIQLSWNYNYKDAGDALGLDLLNNPDLVKNDPDVAWQTAIWYWMNRAGPGTMTGHSAITGGSGFGETIRAINGALECGGGRPDQVQSRVDAYKRLAATLNVDPGSENTLRC
ncbi:glycoside hydrolase family 19 protein [Micromonosporaceae bacterium B7E4]